MGTAGAIWVALTVVNPIAYVLFIRSRKAAGTVSTVTVAVLLSLIFWPLVWFVWLSMRAGQRRADASGAT
jgi:hypothetical protein